MWSDRPDDFERDLVVLRRGEVSRTQILGRLWSCRDGDVVLLNGALGFEHRYADLFYALAVRLRGRRVGLVISDATWHARSTRREARVPLLHGFVEKLLKLMLWMACGPQTHVCFLSREEVRDFVAATGVPESRVHFTPFFPTITAAEEVRLRAARAQGALPYVFAGGNSSRDYGQLIEALAETDHEVRVASRARHRWPKNFRAGPVTHDVFLDLMARASVVVVPLDASTRRSVGQQTYLNAMVLGVPVIVTAAAGVRDMLTDGHDAVIVPAGDALALRRAVDRVMDATRTAEVQRMVRHGQETCGCLTRDRYFARLHDLVCQVEAEIAVSAPSTS